MKITVFVITCSCDSTPFSNSWVVRTKEQALKSVMNEIYNWAESDLEYYRKCGKNFSRLETAWKSRNLQELINSWNNMSSMEIYVEEQEIDDQEEIIFPEFPWNNKDLEKDSEQED